jgi:hypothetical protein
MFESNFPVGKGSCGYAALWNAFKVSPSAIPPPGRRHFSPARQANSTGWGK